MFRPLSETLPWYRELGYDGDLTEAEKRELDDFRALAKHPATEFGDLPDEVEGYIVRLEIERSDLKREQVFLLALACTAVGIALLSLHYFGAPSLSRFETWAWELVLIIAPWFVARHHWNKHEKEDDADTILRHWEVSHVCNSRATARQSRNALS